MPAQPNGGSSDAGSENDLYQVNLSVPWIVRNVPAAQDAINIAVSEVGKRVHRGSKTQMRDCEISVQELSDAQGKRTSEAVLVVANTALVGLLLTCEVQAGSHGDAEAAAQRELGHQFEGVPLVPINVFPIPGNDTGTSDSDDYSKTGA